MKVLLDLKKEYKDLTGEDLATQGAKGKGGKGKENKGPAKGGAGGDSQKDEGKREVKKVTRYASSVFFCTFIFYSHHEGAFIHPMMIYHVLRHQN